jgi:PTS system nitrogen regulatory IIA component
MLDNRSRLSVCIWFSIQWSISLLTNRNLSFGALSPPSFRQGICPREATIRELVDVADRAGMVYLRAELIDEIREREDVCSTALIPGVALPHPRHPVEYDIVDSFVVVGLTHSGIAYGAPDGSLTRLFFLVCCKDERTHLHLLARLAQMLHTPGVLDDLLDADCPEELMETLHACEAKIVSDES